MREWREVVLDDGIVAFDGRVLEVFGQGDARRIHARTIEALVGDPSMLKVKVRGESDTYISFKSPDPAAVDELLAEVRTAAGIG